MRLIDLDAAGHGHVDDARRHERAGQVGGLLAANRTGCRPWWPPPTAGSPAASQAVRADVEALLADLADAAADDLADLGRIDAGALDERLQHGGQQVGRVHGGQAAAAAPDGRADGIDDHDVRT